MFFVFGGGGSCEDEVIYFVTNDPDGQIRLQVNVELTCFARELCCFIPQPSTCNP